MARPTRYIAIVTMAVFALIGAIALSALGVSAQQSNDDVRIVAVNVDPQQVNETQQSEITVSLANFADASREFVVAASVDGDLFDQITVDVAANATQSVRFSGPQPGSLAPGSYVIEIGDWQIDYEVTASVSGTSNLQAAPGGGTGSGSTQNPQVVTGEGGCVIRQPMQIRLLNVREVITREQAGYLELSFRNPPVNDCEVDADLRIEIPTDLIAYSQNADSGVAGTSNTYVEGITPRSERQLALEFRCLRADEYLVRFAGTYWPTGNKDDYRPINLFQRFDCVEASPREEVSINGALPTPGPIGENGTTILSSNNWLIWLLGALVLIVVAGVIFAGIIGVSRRKG